MNDMTSPPPLLKQDDLSPSLWGNDMWMSMYSVAYGYPDHPTHTHIQNAINFFESLKILLPCTECRDGYVDLLIKYPIQNAILNKSDLCRWVNRIHNEINVKLQKQIVVPSQIKSYFEQSVYTGNPLNAPLRDIPTIRKKCRKCKQQK